MRTRFPLAPVAGLATALLLLAVAPAAHAQIYVIESTAPDIKVGVQLAVADNISIPAGASIRAVLPSGKTQTLKGPYSGTLAELAKGHSVNAGVVDWLKEIMKSGGATESTPGATRTFGTRGSSRPAMPFSWSTVPASADGTICVEKNAKLQIARAPVPVAQKVSVVDGQTAASAETEWRANSATVPWPDGIAVVSGRDYYLLVEGRPRRQLKIEVLDRLPADDDILPELQKRGCRYQFEAFLREKLAAR